MLRANKGFAPELAHSTQASATRARTRHHRVQHFNLLAPPCVKLGASKLMHRALTKTMPADMKDMLVELVISLSSPLAAASYLQLGWFAGGEKR